MHNFISLADVNKAIGVSRQQSMGGGVNQPAFLGSQARPKPRHNGHDAQRVNSLMEASQSQADSGGISDMLMNIKNQVQKNTDPDHLPSIHAAKLSAVFRPDQELDMVK
jgi:hypothetical protein